MLVVQWSDNHFIFLKLYDIFNISAQKNLVKWQINHTYICNLIHRGSLQHCNVTFLEHSYWYVCMKNFFPEFWSCSKQIDTIYMGKSEKNTNKVRLFICWGFKWKKKVKNHIQTDTHVTKTCLRAIIPQEMFPYNSGKSRGYTIYNPAIIKVILIHIYRETLSKIFV